MAGESRKARNKTQGNPAHMWNSVRLGLIVIATLPRIASAEGKNRVTVTDLEPAGRIVMPERGISSHRGENHIHPENTLAAFREAIRAGAHQIEMGIYLTDLG